MVGQNTDYIVLKEPANPAYPRGTEVRYSDNYVSRLNRTYSLSAVLGAHVNRIAHRKGLERIVIGSPLNNSEGENILAYMLINSAQAGEWQPFVIDVPYLADTQIATAKEYLDRIESINLRYNEGKIDGGILFGVAIAKRGGLALPIEHGNKVVVVPSQSFIEYVAQQK